ncbi:MAG: helix-turn-helix domain-containing protein [Oscillospiraceae bacterium]|nr:helix-turn-helix domain-containing protein [Oscillospiraceae bacterium]
MNKEQFGNRLKYARKLSGLSVNEIATIIHIHSGDYYYRYERGERTPPPETIVELCNLFKITPNYLFADSIDAIDDLETKVTLLPSNERAIASVVVDELMKKAGREIKIFTNDDIDTTN